MPLPYGRGSVVLVTVAALCRSGRGRDEISMHVELSMRCPVAYLITFTTYGTWLHGDSRGSVDKQHNRYGDDLVALDAAREKKERIAPENQPVVLSPEQEELVLEAILRVCEFRGWFAHVVHVRSNHVDAVVSGREKPEKMMVDSKAYATRAIRKRSGAVIKNYWAWHGSTKYPLTQESLASAIRYVKDEQGTMMAFGQSPNANTQSPERK